MKKVKKKSTEQFLKEIENLKSVVDKLKAFEAGVTTSDNALNLSELKSFSWLENSPVCTKIIDIDFNLQYMSRAGIEKLKIDDISSYYNSQYPLSFYSKSFKVPMEKGLIEAKKFKKTTTQEAPIIDCDGNELWFQSTIIPVNNPQGELDHFLIVSLDITEHKNSEFCLRNSENKLKEALEITSLGTFVFDDGTNTFVTSLISDTILGIDETYNKNIQGWIDLVHPDDLKNAQILLDNEDLEFVSSEFRIIRPSDKKIIWISGHAKKEYNKNGTRTKITGTIQDISKRKEAQEKLKSTKERLKSTFDLSPSIISSVNIETGYFTNANEAITRILGYTLEEFTSKSLIEFIHPDDLEKTTNAISEKLKGNNVASFENRYLCKNGTYKWLAWQGTKPDRNGIITAIGSDISDRKEIENDLKKSIEELEKYRNHLESQNVLLKKEISLSFNYKDMVYSSEEFSNVLTQVEQVSQTDATVLILGETGTGKELIAKAIHNNSPRKNNSLIKVNCAAIPSELIESELFGHIKGAFTGAIDDRIGKFELADGGTLFLDEIGELPLALQPKLLRVIQEGEIEPIGSSKLKKLNVRIVAATNKDLKKEAERKRFREDLFFRLNVFPISIPPLRDRIEDIPVLINHFVNKYTTKHNKVIKYITDATMQEMKSYLWPGNIRELENVIERAVIISNQDLLMVQGFDNSSSNKATIKNYTATLDEVQRNHIIKVLNKSNWNISGNQGAAQILGLKPSTLRDRMKKLGIKRL